jgi:hypothetical protein
MFKGKLGTLLLKLLFKLVRRSSPANIPATGPEVAPQNPVPRSDPQPGQSAPPKAPSRPRPIRRGGRATYISVGGRPRK